MICPFIKNTAFKSENGFCSICQRTLPWSKFNAAQKSLFMESRKVWCKSCYPDVEDIRNRISRYFPLPVTKSVFLKGFQEYFECETQEFLRVCENIWKLSRGLRNPQTIANLIAPVALSRSAEKIAKEPLKIVKLTLNEFHDVKIREKTLIRGDNHVYKCAVRQCGVCGEMKTEKGFEPTQWHGPGIVKRTQRICKLCSSVPEPRRCVGCANVLPNSEFSLNAQNRPLHVPTVCVHCESDKIPYHPYLSKTLSSKVQCFTCRLVKEVNEYSEVARKFLRMANNVNCKKCSKRVKIALQHCSGCDKLVPFKNYTPEQQALARINVPVLCKTCVSENQIHRYYNQGISFITCVFCGKQRKFGEYAPKHRLSFHPICNPCLKPDNNVSLPCCRCAQLRPLNEYHPASLRFPQKICSTCVNSALCFGCEEWKFEFQYDLQARQRIDGLCMTCDYYDEENKLGTTEIQCPQCSKKLTHADFDLDNLWRYRLGNNFSCVSCIAEPQKFQTRG